MRVGLTGGIGSGKSEVAKIFARLGAFVIDTDELAREAVAPNSDGLRQIARIWPQVVRDGALDRAALAEIVFGDPSQRDRLNAIVHPHVRRLAAEREKRAARGQLIVQVVPLLFETGLSETMDKNVVVISPDDQRIARVRERDGSSEARVRARMAAQIEPNEALSRADHVIENDGELDHLRERAETVYAALASARPPV
jgi:dephospho-CoA kinase